MSTEAASSAAPTVITPNLPRPHRGTGTGSSRFNSSRGPRRGGPSANRGGIGASNKSVPESSSDWAAAQEDPSDSSEEVAQLKIKYGNQLKLLTDIFSDWTNEDLVFVLQEVDGDLSLATDRIASGLN
jgi:CUE domain